MSRLFKLVQKSVLLKFPPPGRRFENKSLPDEYNVYFFPII